MKYGIFHLKKVILFISSIGHELYSLIKDLGAPQSVKDQTFDTLSSKLVEPYEPKTNVIVNRYRFHSIKQAEYQSAKDFIMCLKNRQRNAVLAKVLMT